MVPRIELSPNGLEISQLVYGTMRIGEWGANMNPHELADFIEFCVEQGITTFDHADIYGHYSTEALFGEALKIRPDLKEKTEHVSKAGIQLLTERRPHTHIKHYDTTKKYLIAQAETSLKNLNLDALDLFLIHRPDPLMDYDELSQVFDILVSSGKVKYVGVSNFTPSQFAALNSKYSLQTNQIEISLLHHSAIFDGTLDILQANSIKPMIWSPFGGGKLFSDDHYAEMLPIHETIHKMCQKYHCGKDQLLLAWILRLPNHPAPIIGTSKKDRVKAAAEAFAIKLDRQDWFEMLRAVRGQDVA